MLRKVLTFTALLVSSLPANSALYDRGNGLIYDDILDITWLQDSNYAQTSGDDPDGSMSWYDATDWVASLNYGGFDDWRLASANLPDPATCTSRYNGSCDKGYNITYSELGHMYHNNLGNAGFFDTSGNQYTFETTPINTSFVDTPSGNTLSFTIPSNVAYWFSDELNFNPAYAYRFYFAYWMPGGASQGVISKASNSGTPRLAWAVRDGDVSAVPVPAAAWLFGSALAGLAGLKRKK